MEALWNGGESSIREIQESFPTKKRPAYTTIQTMVYRLEAKGIVRRIGKVGNFHIFSAAVLRCEAQRWLPLIGKVVTFHMFAAPVSRSAAQRRLIDDLLALFGGRTQPVMAHLIESGKLTLDDVKEAEKTLRKLERKDKA